ncbi:hypothetical protein LWI28_006524 [Acer negundo]|uniref:Uncharacterized protein n=1 Tax=Acer negundo TaxID=4023 RepID=A0AAD5IQ91_ACENE|nr:hypothetical protein LWI28_006524 [Acer negundo]KAK4845030.1 hypothetical protein QYF36_027461 [Acer negundo]
MEEEADTTPLCLSMIMKYRPRQKQYNYQRLKGVVMVADDKQNVKTDHQRFWKINLIVPAELLMKKFGDAYVEMMRCFARHVSQLNNSRHFYLLERMDPDSNEDYFLELNKKV